ncbi:MAG: FlaD/FlaE family flagellar protein [Thermoplasmatota archaeon]
MNILSTLFLFGKQQTPDSSNVSRASLLQGAASNDAATKTDAAPTPEPAPQGLAAIQSVHRLDEHASANAGATGPSTADPRADSVQEMMEKITRLTSAMESANKDRAEFDNKLQQMEERTRRLASLTEIMSNPYNPFVGDRPQKESLGALDGVGPLPANAAAVSATLPGPGARDASGAAPLPPTVIATSHLRSPLTDEDVEAALSSLDDRSFHALTEVVPTDGSATATQGRIARLAGIGASVESNLLVLDWCECLLRAVSREGLPEILRYYEEIGWISDSAREFLEHVAGGIECEGPAKPDWRPPVDLHERSLLYIERLRAIEARHVRR